MNIIHIKFKKGLVKPFPMCYDKNVIGQRYVEYRNAVEF